MSSIQIGNDEWIWVEPGRDQRLKVLSEFKEKPGPTFLLIVLLLRRFFYNEMSSDSLFDHIVACTNNRALVYFSNTSSSSQSQEMWKHVRPLNVFQSVQI